MAAGGSESSRSRQSSSGEGLSTVEVSEKKSKHQQHNQPQSSKDEGDQSDEKGAEQKGAKKASKKKRRADADEVDTAVPIRSSFHENEQEQVPYHDDIDSEQSKLEWSNTVATEEKNVVGTDLSAEQQQSSKKAQKKKQKGSGKHQSDDEHLQHENKENVGDNLEKVISVPATAAPPTKQKSKSPAPVKIPNYDGK